VGIGEADEVALAVKFAVMRPFLDERGWRVYLGTEAGALGYGGIAAVARAAGVSPATVAAGVAEAGDPQARTVLPPGRSRRAGAGRPRAEGTPGLKRTLDALLEEGKRGDPVSPLTWSVLSLRDIAGQMRLRGFGCSKDTIARLMRADGWSLQGMSRVLEGHQHGDRDAQFGHINATIAEYLAAGQPAISCDAKQKEKPGAYWRAGKSWRPRGGPVKVRDHDFPDQGTTRIIPYGIYDIAANRGFVCVGTSHDTAAFAVNAIRRWWQAEGQARYPHATRLLITCDAGGSNDHRCRLWKDQLAVLAAETGLLIEVCHFPPGTSKWNKIEHRVFCHITRTWRARPLMTIEDAVAGIAATVTAQGLKCTAVTGDSDYPDGIKISDEQMTWLESRVLDRAAFRGQWNYQVAPAPRQGPQPAPARPRYPGPDPALLAALTTLAGTPAPAGLHAAVAVTWYADRERHKAILRNGPRRRAPRKTESYRKLSDEAILVAAACRIRLGMTWVLLGRLLGVHDSTLCAAAGNAVPILEQHGITAGSQPPITTMDKLLQRARQQAVSPAAFGNLPPQEKRPKRDTPPATTRPKPPTK
jgi:hypothetical protein